MTDNNAKELLELRLRLYAASLVTFALGVQPVDMSKLTLQYSKTGSVMVTYDWFEHQFMSLISREDVVKIVSSEADKSPP
jgi:hypothetical protein